MECSVTECLKPGTRRGWCESHYRKWQRHGDPEVQVVAEKGLPRKWIREVVTHRDRSDCWLDRPWRSQNVSGYPTATDEQGVQGVASHLVLTYDDRPQPVDKPFALHSCDNPACLNPNHLRWGTNAENMEDMASRGRGRNRPQYGEENPMARLTAQSVTQIRSRLDAGEPQKDIAMAFRVSRMTISEIARRKTWRHLP